MKPAFPALATLAFGGCMGYAGSLAAPTAEDVIGRLVEMDHVRAGALRGYKSERRYIADNERFSKHAEVAVEEWFVPPDQKDLRVISETGSPVVRRRVIDKVIEAELDSVQDGNRNQTHVTPENYTFRMIGREVMYGNSCFVLELIPRAAKKYLIQGRIWVDQTDFAIVRMEGRPAKNPSIWTRSVHFVRRYEKHGPFWLPASLESESRILIVGESTLKIEYSNYRIETNSQLVSESGAP